MLTKAPNIWTLECLIDLVANGSQTSDDGSLWAPARPEGYFSFRARLKAAWLVFTGKADAVVW